MKKLVVLFSLNTSDHFLEKKSKQQKLRAPLQSAKNPWWHGRTKYKKSEILMKFGLHFNTFFDSMAWLTYLRSVKSEECLDVSGKVSHCWLKYRQIKLLIEKVRLYYVSLETFDHFFENNLNHQSREPSYPSKKSSMTWRKMKLKCWPNLGYILKPFWTGWSDLLVLSTIWEIVRYSGKHCSSFVLLPENDIINQKNVL